jgi:glycerol kinase
MSDQASISPYWTEAMSQTTILALDQGTTNTRALLFDMSGRVVSSSSRPLDQIFPEAGWVEHDAEAVFNDAVAVVREVLQQSPVKIPTALGITNQRETVVVWDRKSGDPVANAIVWQDRRTAERCAELRDSGVEAEITRKTGLLLDPYFSATKIAWILDNTEGVRQRAESGELLAGTMDCWLLWKLTGARVHLTDATNASRTMLFDIHRGAWDNSLLEIFDVPASLLPDVGDCQGQFGVTDADLIGAEIPITGIAGDQQAAAYGQACLEPGSTKATFGTGCFVLANTGGVAVASQNRLLTTIFTQIGGVRRYALEGSLFMAGATIQWLRDNLGIIADASDTETLAGAADPNSGVYLVPAFQGLGAPHWDAEARAVISGLSRAAGKAEIVRAALEGVAYQTMDLMAAIEDDFASAGAVRPRLLRVDGGMARNNWFMQFLADILDMPIERASQQEATALGAAFHAGLAGGLFKDESQCAALWESDLVFEPSMRASERAAKIEGWAHALAGARTNG